MALPFNLTADLATPAPLFEGLLEQSFEEPNPVYVPLT
jgi:hypothetical protein